ncbi:MAG: hypothetical protein ACPGN3_14355 [Opitutales bacterium]
MTTLRCSAFLIAIIVYNFLGQSKSHAFDIDVGYELFYGTQLLDKGGEYFGDESAILQGVSIDFGDTGFGFDLGYRFSGSRGYVNKERIDYKLRYGSSVFEEERHQIDYGLGFIYHQHHRGEAVFEDFYEWEMSLAMPRLLPGSWTPSYTVAAEHALEDSILDAGWWHRIAVDKVFQIEGVSPPLKFHADLAYRDGLGGINAWTHSTFGLGADFKLLENLVLSPNALYQVSLSDRLTDENVAAFVCHFAG